MEKRRIVNYCNLGGFALYVVGRFARIPTLAVTGLLLIVIGLITTLIYRKEFTKFEFWLAIVVLAMFAVALILLLHL